MRQIYFLLFTIITWSALAQTPVVINEKSTTRHGPEKGSLLIIGGGKVGPEIWNTFVTLAGGKEKAKIVVVTAAAGNEEALKPEHVESIRKQSGVAKVTLLHTKKLTEANSEAFIAPLKEATGVYFIGGRQWRLADSYLNTLTHQAFFEVLNRGGVIAGSSAGASIQGSFLWRGDTKGAQILVGDHTQGLGFLKNSAIDQHLLKRNRQFDLIDFIKNAPELIGIGLDESTAIVVQQDTFEVVGKSYVAVYDYQTILGKSPSHDSNAKENFTTSNGGFILLSEGQKYDLKNRKVLSNP